MSLMRSGANPGGPIPDADLRAAVARCGADAALMEGLRRIYEKADRAVAGTGAVCLGGGNCCKFDLFGHRLFLTVAELALLVAEDPPDAGRAARGRCPYQVGPHCSAYPRRPLGCRTFFCRNGQRQPAERLGEQYHAEIRGLHEDRNVPYAYGELVALLTRFLGGK